MCEGRLCEQGGDLLRGHPGVPEGALSRDDAHLPQRGFVDLTAETLNEGLRFTCEEESVGVIFDAAASERSGELGAKHCERTWIHDERDLGALTIEIRRPGDR